MSTYLTSLPFRIPVNVPLCAYFIILPIQTVVHTVRIRGHIPQQAAARHRGGGPAPPALSSLTQPRIPSRG